MDKMTAHYLHLANQRKPLSFDRHKPLEIQRQAISEKYRELLRMPKERGEVPFVIEYEKQDSPEYEEIRFRMETEPGFFVPAHMLLPKDRKKGEKFPVVICLQGHSTAIHVSLGRCINPGDECAVVDQAFALQAVRRGYAAIALEMRGFGELKTGVTLPQGAMCHQMAMQSLMVGRTLLGERIHDIRTLAENLGQFGELDTGRVGIMGISGGATASYHAAAMIPEITAVMADCSFNRYDASIMSLFHCSCNYIPGIAKYMEMEDLAVLIAPRQLLLVNGRMDEIFPIEAAQNAYETVKEVYEVAGAPQNCHMVIGEYGHHFSENDAWPVFEKML